jgi:hypothetical protein
VTERERWGIRTNKERKDTLRLEDIAKFITQLRLTQYFHAERMENQRMPKQIVRATMEGRKKTGRPRTRWRAKFEGNCILLGYYAASSGNSLIDVSGQSIGHFLTLENGTDRLSRNVRKESPLLAT